MFGIETLSGNAHALAVVGVVLAEALALNVGYGVLTRLAGPAVTNTVRGD